MSTSQFHSWGELSRFAQDGAPIIAPRHATWRAGRLKPPHAMSRRVFVKSFVGITGLALSSGLWMPMAAHAEGQNPGHERDRGRGTSTVAPNPIPGGIQPLGPGTEVFHVFPPNPANLKQEPASITDFRGFFGVTEITGTGTGINTKTGQSTRLNFDVDVRFMKGTYVGVDGKRHYATFGFQ